MGMTFHVAGDLHWSEQNTPTAKSMSISLGVLGHVLEWVRMTPTPGFVFLLLS